MFPEVKNQKNKYCLAVSAGLFKIIKLGALIML